MDVKNNQRDRCRGILDKRKHVLQRLEQQKLLCKFRQALHRGRLHRYYSYLCHLRRRLQQSDADAEQVKPYSNGRDRRNCTDIQDHDGSHNTRHRDCRPDIRQKRGYGHDHSSTGYRLYAEVAHSYGQQRKKHFHHGFQVSDAGFRRDDKCCI